MPRANYSTSMANIFEAHARNLRGGEGAEWGGVAGICAQDEDREVYETLKHGARNMQQTKHMEVGKCVPHEKRPIAGVLHVAHADTNHLGMLRVISV